MTAQPAAEPLSASAATTAAPVDPAASGPAREAEDRAFCALAPEERTEFLRLARLYTEAIDRELAAIKKGEMSQ